VATADIEAVTAYTPATVLAVNVVPACPLASVAATTFVVLLLNIPPGPLLGAVKVTVTPLTGLPKPSCTSAIKGFANAIPTLVLCPEPENAVIAAADPADTVIFPEEPVTELVTVSVAVMIWLPAVFNVALNAAEPFVSAELAGSNACASV